MTTQTMNPHEAVRKALKWVLEDFPESSIYQDYQETERFTDDGYDAMLKALRRFAEQPEEDAREP